VAVLYRGTVEVETLVRTLGVAPGTRVTGELVLSTTGTRHMKYSLDCQVATAGATRPFGFESRFDWNGSEGKPFRWSQTFRGRGVTFTTKTFLDYVTQSLTCSIEEQSTGRGNQRFRVVRVDWTKERRKPSKSQHEGS
jgi:hypothetical protein